MLPFGIQKAKLLSIIRTFFRNKDFFETCSPQVQPAAAMEPFVDNVQINGSSGFLGVLATSPEFAMKKSWPFLKDNYAGIFELAHCFRDDPPTRIHLKEFIMCEWYMPGNILNMITFTDELLQSCLDSLDKEKPGLERISLPDTWLKLFKEPLADDLALLNKVAKSIGIDTVSQESDPSLKRDFLFSAILEHGILPNLYAQHQLFSLEQWPAWTRGMSRLNNDGWAEKFELYYNGLELCNAYQEEHDQDKIRSHWLENNAIRKRRGYPEHPIDEELLSLLHHQQGVTGNALGVDRIFMAAEQETGSTKR